HLNPVRAGLVQNPQKHNWTSHSAYLKPELLPWINSDFVLSQFGSTRATSTEAFDDFVMMGVPAEFLRQIEGPRRPNVLSLKSEDKSLVKISGADSLRILKARASKSS